MNSPVLLKVRCHVMQSFDLCPYLWRGTALLSPTIWLPLESLPSTSRRCSPLPLPCYNCIFACSITGTTSRLYFSFLSHYFPIMDELVQHCLRELSFDGDLGRLSSSSFLIPHLSSFLSPIFRGSRHDVIFHRLLCSIHAGAIFFTSIIFCFYRL